MSFNKHWFTFIFLFFVSAMTFGQDANVQKVKALNNYVNFSNESTHGLLIVHRLLENFNKNINKYVDLPDKQMNHYSNKDLPKHIFEDPEHWFYDTSPNEWYREADSTKKILPIQLHLKLGVISAEMKSIYTKVNKIRFDLEDQIKTLDLTKRENLSLIYDKLEEGVSLYKDFYVKQQMLESEIAIYYKTLKVSKDELQFTSVLASMAELYKSSRSALDALYKKEDDNYSDLVSKHEKALKDLDTIKLVNYNSTRLINSRVQMYWTNIKKQSKDAIQAEKLFAEGETIPEEYKLYDKYYYFYNISVINKFNRYGNGIVFEMNRILEYIEAPMPRFFELPHYFKVIYPKMLDKTEYLAASDPVVKALPKVIKGRDVVTATRTIRVDNQIVDFKIYDHKIVDRDIVSLSFNGDWIVEKYMISEVPYEFRLKLNDKGKNFLLLYADDMGRNPPATIAISYTYKGKTELIILNSDTKKSEIIEIIVD